ncbi:hypothetical protein [Actinoplanes aureus]|uniref:Uncharacterized protein n=1 Tax=Actinoplanes aureus TaxID=2792083 RepID=A0A931CFF0_9ACTN|nr:hypothetical protein [Actinoplanes aureus]MBG0565556.1 hypothetical protein [Actinoplanes aureus]
MAIPLADGSILSFTPDGRFSSVEFGCYRGDEMVTAVSLPFLGWAVVAFQQADGPGYYTQLLAVGLRENGRPATEVDVRRMHDVDGDQGIRTRLIAAAPEVGAGSLSRIPVDEIIGIFDDEPDPLFEGETPLYEPEIFPRPDGDAADDEDPEIFPPQA